MYYKKKNLCIMIINRKLNTFPQHLHFSYNFPRKLSCDANTTPLTQRFLSPTSSAVPLSHQSYSKLVYFYDTCDISILHEPSFYVTRVRLLRITKTRISNEIIELLHKHCRKSEKSSMGNLCKFIMLIEE